MTRRGLLSWLVAAPIGVPAGLAAPARAMASPSAPALDRTSVVIQTVIWIRDPGTYVTHAFVFAASPQAPVGEVPARSGFEEPGLSARAEAPPPGAVR